MAFIRAKNRGIQAEDCWYDRWLDSYPEGQAVLAIVKDYGDGNYGLETLRWVELYDARESGGWWLGGCQVGGNAHVFGVRVTKPGVYKVNERSIEVVEVELVHD